MTSTMMANGKLRKSLAEEIDRLHSILDGLAESLNEAVVSAVKEAVGVAVKETLQAVIAEVLTNEELLNAVRGFVAPQVQPEAQQAQSQNESKLPWVKLLLAKAAGWASGCFGYVGTVGKAFGGKISTWAGGVKSWVAKALTKVRSSFATSSGCSGRSSSSTSAAARATRSRMASARGVGTSRLPERTNSGSPTASRRRARVWLIAGGLTCMRRAAPVTLPASNSAWSASSKFASADSI